MPHNPHGHYEDIAPIVGRVKGRDGLVHAVEERVFKRTGMCLYFEHCNDEPLFPENLISNEVPISCLMCLAVRFT